MDKFLVSLVGKKYKLACYDGTAFDCYSLIWYIYNHYGITLPKINIGKYSMRLINSKVIQESKKWVEVNFKDRKFLDILTFNTTKHLTTHIGLVINDKCFIHTTKETNVVISRFYRNIYLANLSKVYRWSSL